MKWMQLGCERRRSAGPHRLTPRVNQASIEKPKSAKNTDARTMQTPMRLSKQRNRQAEHPLQQKPQRGEAFCGLWAVTRWIVDWAVAAVWSNEFQPTKNANWMSGMRAQGHTKKEEERGGRGLTVNKAPATQRWGESLIVSEMKGMVRLSP